MAIEGHESKRARGQSGARQEGQQRQPTLSEAGSLGASSWGVGLGCPAWIEPAMPMVHSAFNVMNKYASVPALKAGLGGVMSTPITGYLMILRTRGRKSGQWRDAPLGYIVIDDAVYCMAGFGARTHWLQNVMADPRVEVILPGRAFSGVAEEVTEADERRRIMPPLVRSMGLVAFGFGLGNPYSLSAEELVRRCEAFPLVRVRATGIAAGPSDPGGWYWVVPAVGAGLLFVRWLRGLGGRRFGRCG